MSIGVTPEVGTSTWQIDPVHSTAQFKVKHMMISNVKGEFTSVTGALELNETDITKSKLEASIDATTINTRTPQRDAHLKSADFLETEKFPVLTFKSTSVSKETNGDLAVKLTSPCSDDSARIRTMRGDLSLKSFVRFALWIALTSAAFGQQKVDPQRSQGPPQRPAQNTFVRSYPGSDKPGSKVVRTRTESGDREVIAEIVEVPGPDGRFATATKTTTETVGIGSNSVKITREVFGNGAYGRLTLIETSVAHQENFPDGTTQTTTDTWVPDLSGRLNLSSRRIEQTKSLGPDVQQTLTTLYVPTINEPLRETERVLKRKRRVRPDLVQTDSQRNVRDVNGQWQTTETRTQEVRTAGRNEVVEEETVRNLDHNGKLTVSKKTITHRSTNNGLDHVVTEVYSPYTPGLATEPGNRLALNQRIRVTTSNAGSQTISEKEAPDPSVLNGPIRLVARTVETVRQIGPDAWETQRQTFTLDGSGRLVLTTADEEETKGK